MCGPDALFTMQQCGLAQGLPMRLRYSKVRFNCFESEGSCLLPVMALFNHSCAPNAAITRLGMVEVL